MADRATGPVKPPVIDLTARSTRPEGEPQAANDSARPRRRLRLTGLDWPVVGVAVAGGAVLGTILTYLLAGLLPLPGRTPDLSPLVTTQIARIDSLQRGLDAVTAIADGAGANLTAATGKLGADIDALNKQLADVKAAIPAPAAPLDLAPLEAQIHAIKTEVDALEAGVPGTDASDVAKTLGDLQTGVGSLATRLNGVDATLSALRTDLEATRKTLNDHINAALPNEVGPALKLPLILSGLEDAFATGRPFAAELEALASVLPASVPPEALKAAAGSGLARPDMVMTALEARVPDILAAQSRTDADWVSRSGDWLKSLLAIRPAEETAGDAPDAVVSRLEGAVQRRDFTAAAALLGQLPPPMQDAAGTVARDITAHAEAAAFVADLRTRALASAETTP
ncbi:MAG: hypothetical protein ABI697_00270 [Devosia sp.]